MSSAKKPLHAVLKELLKKFRRKDRMHIFWEPVPRTVPGYYESIQQPMDFETMETKMRKARYASLDDFFSDYMLIIRNCKSFNHELSDYFATAEMMEKYGKEAVDMARDTVDMSLPPSAKYAPGDDGGSAATPSAPNSSTTFILPLTGTGTAQNVPASSAAAAQGAAGQTTSGMTIVESLAAAQAKRAAIASGAAAPATTAKTKRERDRANQAKDLAMQDSFPSCSLAAQGASAVNHSIFNPTLYPQLNPATMLAQGFTHPLSLPESVNYWQPAPYPSHHPLSLTGTAQAAMLSSSTTQGVGAGGKRLKNQQALKQLPGRGRRDVRLMSGPGVDNNFNMALQPTNLDLVTVWEREQEMWKQTGKNALVREENDCYSGVGPLSYPDYKPSMHSSFDQKYVERVQRFVRQGLLGDAAAVLPVPGHAAETHAHLNTGLTSNVYSHLLKESSMHKCLQSKLDSIQNDPSLRATAKDFVPSALALGLPRAQPVPMKAGEPMGISLADVQNIRSLMGDLEGMMKQAVAYTKMQHGQAAQPATPAAPAAAAATAAADKDEPAVPMDVDAQASGVKSEPGVAPESQVKTEGEPTVKQEPPVKREPTAAAMDTSDSAQTAAATPAAANASATAAGSSSAAAAAGATAVAAAAPKRLVQVDFMFVSLSSGSAEISVRIRASPESMVPWVAPESFTPGFLASILQQPDIAAMRVLQSVGERMVGWHHTRAKVAMQQRAQMQQQQALKQSQAAAAAAAAATATATAAAAAASAASNSTSADDPPTKRVKLESGGASSADSNASVAATPSPSPQFVTADATLQSQSQQQLLAQQQQVHLRQQQQQQQQQQLNQAQSLPSVPQSAPSSAAAGVGPQDEARWAKQMEMQKQVAAQMQRQQQQQQQQSRQMQFQQPAPMATPQSQSHAQAPPSQSVQQQQQQSQLPAAPPAPLTGSRAPEFQRSNLPASLRSLHHSLLDRLLTQGMLSPSGAIQVEIMQIVGQLKLFATEQQQQQQHAAAAARATATPNNLQQQYMQQQQAQQQLYQQQQQQRQ